ncbi:hypothetical protein ElyMa_003218000 [Elysia marginata]|uniref:SMB domain-containing protein n=1 Tax=Elysia marginata TaxID=1093978 RepID=A0AAV4J3P7_9GAST|nr:hypothetical protein ElyMa_003218000 [Elysia marginata]
MNLILIASNSITTVAPQENVSARMTLAERDVHTNPQDHEALKSEGNTCRREFVGSEDVELNQPGNITNLSRLTERVRESKSLNVLGSFSSDTKSGRPKPENTTRSSTSCNQRCGEDASFPCSCDEKCVVHKTCCHDLEETCPVLYKQAVTKFEHLLSASVRCDAISVVLMVQSCPVYAEEIVGDLKEDAIDKVTQNRSPVIKRSRGVNQRKNVNTIQNILTNAPVTDFGTGIIYANASIYECNKREKTLYAPQASANLTGTWKTQIGTLFKNIHVADIKEELHLSTYSYIPPQSHRVTSKSLCYNQRTLSCIANLSASFGIHDIMCNTSVSEYYNIRKDFLSLPYSDERVRENICDVCMAEFQSAPGAGDRFFLSGFRVLMSLSATPAKVVYDLHEELRGLRQTNPWWSWTCDDNVDPADPSCRVLKCDPRFLFTEDGLCRRLVEAEFSIQEEILYNGMVFKMDVEVFVGFIKCFMKTFCKVLPTEKPYRTYRLYHARTGTNLTAVRLEMYFNLTDLEYRPVLFDFVGKFDAFYASMLFFTQNHCSLKQDIERKTPPAKDNSSLPISDGVLDVRGASIMKGKDIFSITEKSTMAQMLEKFVFIMCLQLVSMDSDLTDDITCDEWSEYMHFTTDATMKSLLSKTKDSECIQVENGSFKSLAFPYMPFPFLICFSGAISMLVM